MINGCSDLLTNVANIPSYKSIHLPNTTKNALLKFTFDILMFPWFMLTCVQISCVNKMIEMSPQRDIADYLSAFNLFSIVSIQSDT